MENTRKLVFFILLAIPLLFLSCKGVKERKQTKEDTHENMETFVFEEIVKGKKQWTLKGDKAIIIDDSSDIIIDNPNMTFYNGDQPSSLVTALKGQVNTKTKDMKAEGNVYIKSLKEGATIKSEEMFYKNKTKKFYSTKFVKIERAESITTGIGFEATEDLSVINVKKDVAIEYKE